MSEFVIFTITYWDHNHLELSLLCKSFNGYSHFDIASNTTKNGAGRHSSMPPVACKIVSEVRSDLLRIYADQALN